MTTDTTTKKSENPKKNKQIWGTDEGKQSKKGKRREVWSCKYCLQPVGVAKVNETEIFEINALIHNFLIIY